MDGDVPLWDVGYGNRNHGGHMDLGTLWTEGRCGVRDDMDLGTCGLGEDVNFGRMGLEELWIRGCVD